MKMKTFSFVAIVAFVAGISGCAHDKNTTQTPGQQGTNNFQYLTGSYNSQDVQRNGPVTNGKSNVRVLDESDIENSGGATVGQALKQTGAARVRSP
jgi:hypothetical protein